MPFLVILIAVLALLAAPNRSQASDDEIRQRKVIFILEDFRHWAELRYRFQDRGTNTEVPNSSSHEFYETYNASLGFDIINPHFFFGSLTGKVGMTQSRHNSGQESNSVNSNRYEYQFTGSGLDRSPTPYTLTSFSTTETVLSPFSPAFTSTITGNSVDLQVINALVPSRFSYSRRTIDNSGGGNSSTTSSDSFIYNANHQYRGISSSSLGISLSQFSGGFTGGSLDTSRSYSASLGNTLNFGAEQKYSLTTQARVYQSISQKVPQRSTHFEEAFHDHLGKALDLLVGYSYANTRITDFDGVDTGTTSQTGEVEITHHLFESLTTRLRGKFVSNQLLQGKETHYGTSEEMDYKKKLPGDNVLILGLMGGQEVVDNQQGSPLSSVVDQLHAGVHQGEVINLQLNGVLSSVVSVRSTNPFVVYTEGQDYRVDLGLGQINILVGGRIDQTGTGMDLLISYLDFNNTNVKYLTTTYKGNGAISFKGGKYLLGGSYTSTHMGLLRGESQNSLRDTTLRNLFFSGNLDSLKYRFNYSNTTVGEVDSTAAEASFQYQKDTAAVRLTATGSERVNWFNATSSSPSYSDYSTTLNLTALGVLFSAVRTTVSLNFFDERSGLRRPRDIVSLIASMQYQLNKFALTLNGQTAWTFTGGVYSRDDIFTMDLVRYF
jgi:hypothetical protein